MSRWSRDVQPPRSRFRRDAHGPGRRRVRFAEPDGTDPYSPVIEERHPQRRHGSVEPWWKPRPRRHVPASDDYHLRRTDSSSTEDYPRCFHLPPQQIILSPLPSQPRRRSIKKRKKLYFIRPHDGHPEHRRETLGRLKDAFTGEGPDVFVTSTTRERLMRDRPHRWHWSGYDPDEEEIFAKIVEPGFAWSELECVREMPWAGRWPKEGYDFRTRRYGVPDKDCWTDARWSAGARKGSWPERYRDGKFRWRSRVL